MTNKTQVAIDGYVQLASYLVGEWGRRVSSFAADIEQGSVDTESLMAKANDCMMFAVQTVALIVNEAMDAAMVMGGSEDKPNVIEEEFETAKSENGKSGGAASGPRSLQLAGPLIADLGHDSIPVTAVTLKPAALGPNETKFKLVVDGTGHPALGYSGRVQVLDANGKAIETIDVWVTT